MRHFLLAATSLLALGCHQLPATLNLPAKPQPEVSGSRETSVAKPETAPTEWIIHSIDWDDADSGDINGIRFRLYSVDAPETGGVGAAVGPAKCDLERERGLQAKAWMIAITPPSALKITATHGHDKMREPRLLIELAANGQDVGEAGMAKGYLKPWPHNGSKPLAKKPDWCKP